MFAQLISPAFGVTSSCPGFSSHQALNSNCFILQVSIVSAKSIKGMPGWLCGGSIIHPQLVLTSAACLHTVSNMYVIAGYRKYVRTEDLKRDICAVRMKKRIIYYCLHSGKLLKK